jgi:hypothetical protein
MELFFFRQNESQISQQICRRINGEIAGPKNLRPGKNIQLVLTLVKTDLGKKGTIPIFPKSVTKTTVERLPHQSPVENETVSFSTITVTDSIPEAHPESCFSKEIQREKAVRGSVTNFTSELLVA